MLQEDLRYRDLTNVFMSKITIKMKPIKKEQPSQFIEISTQLKERIDICRQRLQEFHQLAQHTGLFNNHDDKLNGILQTSKEDLDWSKRTLDQLNALKNNELTQSIYDLLQQQLLNLSEFFKKNIQGHTKRIKEQEDHRPRLVERDRVTRRGGFNRKSTSPDQQSEQQAIYMQMEEKVSQDKLTSMKKIEQMLNDIATVFQRVGTMVKMHETMIDRIDKYTDDSLSNVQKGRKELQEAHKRISENRGFILKIFLIMVVFSTLYIVFVL
ncbi:hypothetical protein pb186bvf_000117 [Paramecium bursaria]